MGKKVFIIGVIIMILAAAFFLYSKRGKKAEAIGTTGIVEGTEVNLSSKVSGRISEFCCKEGDRVIAGHVVARLESDDIKASVEQAMAAVSGSKADIASAESSVKNSDANVKSSEADIGAARADMERAKSQMVVDEKDMHREEQLYKTGLISTREVDLAIAAYETSAAAYNAAQAKINAAIARKESAISQLNSSRSLLTAARARLKEAQAALKLQETRLDDTVIRTPISGTVVLKAMETGEVVSPGVTILSIVDLDDLWVRIDLEETLIGFVKLGDEVNIRIDAMPEKSFTGKVAEIGREADFATQRDVTRGKQDIKTFGIKIKTTDKTGTLKPGMTVLVEIPGKE